WREAVVWPVALPAHGDVMVVAFNPDGKTFATAGRVEGGAGGFVQIWDACTLKPVGEPLAYPTVVRALAYSPDRNRLLVGGPEARVWDLRARKWDGDAFGRGPGKDPILRVAFSPDGRAVALCGTNRPAMVLDVVTGKPKFTFDEGDDPKQA